MNLPEMFGENVFNDSVQKDTLPRSEERRVGKECRL